MLDTIIVFIYILSHTLFFLFSISILILVKALVI